MSTACCVPNKDLAKVVKAATARGWELEPAGKSKFKIVNGGHWHTVAKTPSDRNAHWHLAKRIRRCEEHRCEHGAPWPVVRQDAVSARILRIKGIIQTPSPRGLE